MDSNLGLTMPANKRAATRLDPRNPLVIDTRELGRRPGSMRELRRSVPAPSGFGLELVGVPAGSVIDLDVRLEAVMEGVLVSGQAYAQVAGECARCLDPVTTSIEADVLELYAYPGHAPDDDDIGRLEGAFIDFEPRLRDAIVLALPFRPVCREDCPGLCPTCGVRLADAAPDHGHDAPDERWAALRLVHFDSNQSEG
jgi:uncharacterized protein